jgi:hypothetical protein
MLVKVTNAKLGGEVLIERTVLRAEGGVIDGFSPRLGLTVIIGATGSGKTLFAEALWLGTANVLAELLGGGYRDLRDILLFGAGLRPLSFTYELRLAPHEFGDDLKISADINEGRLEGLRVEISGREVGGEALRGDAELRERLAYAAAHVAALPERAKYALLLRGGVLTEALSRRYEPCGPLAAVLPPASYMVAERIVSPCYIEELSVPGELRLEVAEVFGSKAVYNVRSLGEVSAALIKTWPEALSRVREAAVRRGVSAIPMVYIDDAFDGLDGRRLNNVLKEADRGDVAVYASTHRLESLSVVRRAYAITYDTRLSELVDKPSKFRIGFVDLDRVEDRYYQELCEKLAWPDAEMCKSV